MTNAIATLGGGCFWCLEAVFERLDGVTRVVSGYAGGEVPDPTYREVCSGLTGHAEVVQVEFDPQQLAYTELLAVFFATHDPTTLNRQGNDIGTQYRSIILTHDDEQAAAARQVIAALQAAGELPGPVVTQVEPLQIFYAAEDYHQEYFRQNSDRPYCRLVVAPKVAKFKKLFAERDREPGS